MKTYLSNLNEREKWMVIATVICLIAYCYYALLYNPLKNRVTSSSAQLVEKTETLRWMNEVKNIPLNAQKKQSTENGTLLTLLATKLKDNEIQKFPYQLQQTSSGDIQLSFNEIPFKWFIQWLAKIDASYIIHIKQFNADSTETPGVTKLTLILSSS